MYNILRVFIIIFKLIINNKKNYIYIDKNTFHYIINKILFGLFLLSNEYKCISSEITDFYNCHMHIIFNKNIL